MTSAGGGVFCDLKKSCTLGFVASALGAGSFLLKPCKHWDIK